VHAVGDVQLGLASPPERATLPPDGAKGFFDAVKPVLGGADLVFGNLETVLADHAARGKCGASSPRCVAIRAPTASAAVLKDAGFTVLSVANNHADDFLEEGRVATVKALEAAGLAHAGRVGDVAFVTVRGLKVAVIGFSTGLGFYQVQNLEQARRVIAETAARADVVIVSFHAGAEGSNAGASAAHVPKGPETFHGEDRGDVVQFAHSAIDAGASLVLGHGPHQWRGVELYRGRLIAYSLGNFCTWNTFDTEGPLGLSAVLEVRLAANGAALEARLVSTALPRPGRPVLDPTRRALGLVRALSASDFGDEVFDAEGHWAPSPGVDLILLISSLAPRGGHHQMNARSVRRLPVASAILHRDSRGRDQGGNHTPVAGRWRAPDAR
jgi:poly-gamma-glutamate capsule biosynthesis protein CapA/YwtB (metallophosphatase superfamily)